LVEKDDVRNRAQGEHRGKQVAAHAGDAGTARPAREIKDWCARRGARASDADDGDLDRASRWACSVLRNGDLAESAVTVSPAAEVKRNGFQSTDGAE
jgi:hypothetical protein